MKEIEMTKQFVIDVIPFGLCTSPDEYWGLPLDHRLEVDSRLRDECQKKLFKPERPRTLLVSSVADRNHAAAQARDRLITDYAQSGVALEIAGVDWRPTNNGGHEEVQLLRQRGVSTPFSLDVTFDQKSYSGVACVHLLYREFTG